MQGAVESGRRRHGRQGEGFSRTGGMQPGESGKPATPLARGRPNAGNSRTGNHDTRQARMRAAMRRGERRFAARGAETAGEQRKVIKLDGRLMAMRI
jgi:hypothetical protein